MACAERGGSTILPEPTSNLFRDLPDDLPEEAFLTLAATEGFRLARIVSTGQATPEGEWYDQERAEWVVVLKGSAALRFEDEAEDRLLRPGDFVDIPAHRRHRVVRTDPDGPTVWLALYYDPTR